jgi:hypothetical protein
VEVKTLIGTNILVLLSFWYYKKKINFNTYSVFWNVNFQTLEISKTIVPKLKLVWKFVKCLQKFKTPIIIGDFYFKIVQFWKRKMIPFYFLKWKGENLPKEKWVLYKQRGEGFLFFVAVHLIEKRVINMIWLLLFASHNDWSRWFAISKYLAVFSWWWCVMVSSIPKQTS